MPVPDQVLDHGSGIHKISKLLDPGFRRDDAVEEFPTYYETIKLEI